MPNKRSDRRRATDAELDAAANISQADLDNAVAQWDATDDGFAGLLDAEPTGEKPKETSDGQADI